MEKRRTSAALDVRDFDAHDAELEKLVHELVWNLGLLIHRAHERPDLAVGELVDAVTKKSLVVRQKSERRTGGFRRLSCHRNLDRTVESGQPNRSHRSRNSITRSPDYPITRFNVPDPP